MSKEMTVIKDQYDDMIYHLYTNHSKSYPNMHVCNIFHDVLIALIPEHHIEELNKLRRGEAWQFRLKFSIIPEN